MSAKSFSVFRHPVHGLEAVKHGFSWPALFFTAIWAWLKGMWGVGFGFFGAMLLLVIFETGFKEGGQEGLAFLMLLAELALIIWFAKMGNAWRVDNLLKRGYQLIGRFEAENPDAAIAVAGHPTDVKNEFEEGTAGIAPGSMPRSAVDDLERLAMLKEKGLVTEQEFNAKKKQLLGF